MLNFFSKATASGQTSLMKISDGSLKSVSASSQLSKPGTTVLRVSGGVITTAAAPAVALPTNAKVQLSKAVRSQPAAWLIFAPPHRRSRKLLGNPSRELHIPLCCLLPTSCTPPPLQVGNLHQLVVCPLTLGTQMFYFQPHYMAEHLLPGLHCYNFPGQRGATSPECSQNQKDSEP